MRVVGIVGFKKSGKTTLGVALSKALKEMDYRVSVIKHVNENLDFPDTDSRKYSDYAEVVAAVSAGQTEMVFKGERSLEDLLAYANGDIVLVEGFKTEKTYPKIACLRKDEDKEPLLDGLEICTAGFDRTITDYDIANPDHVREMARLAFDRAFKLPNLDCEQCGYASCYDLARAIVKGTERIDACHSLHPMISIKIDGKNMPLNNFTNALFRNTLMAMLSSLKGYRKGNIEIEIP